MPVPKALFWMNILFFLSHAVNRTRFLGVVNELVSACCAIFVLIALNVGSSGKQRFSVQVPFYVVNVLLWERKEPFYLRETEAERDSIKTEQS